MYPCTLCVSALEVELTASYSALSCRKHAPSDRFAGHCRLLQQHGDLCKRGLGWIGLVKPEDAVRSQQNEAEVSNERNNHKTAMVYRR